VTSMHLLLPTRVLPYAERSLELCKRVRTQGIVITILTTYISNRNGL